jgi:hypothetical protein
VLFQSRDALVQHVDVAWCTQPGFVPGLFAERFGEPAFELLDVGVLAKESGEGVGKVGLQRRAADLLTAVGGRRRELGGVDEREQVVVPVAEAAVDARLAGDRRDADLGASAACQHCGHGRSRPCLVREITRNHIQQALLSQGSDRALVGQVLRSLFRVLKARRMVFTNPTTHSHTANPRHACRCRCK